MITRQVNQPGASSQRVTRLRKRLCYVVSSEMTVSAFLAGHIAAAQADDYEVSVVANAKDDGFLRRQGLSVVFYPVAIVRNISPWRDALALFSLIRLFHAERFEIVHSVSPKAGILAMLAARIAGVPNCVHTFTGQVWITLRGVKRWALKQADCLLARLTTRSLVDSPSQRDFLIEEGVLNAEKSEVIGKGSICGVDGGRFRPDIEIRRELRYKLGIPQSAPLLLFLGRLTLEKGMLDLANAFVRLTEKFPEVRILFVGPDESEMVRKISNICEAVYSNVYFVDYTDWPEHFMAAADIFCLPSYREGFGMAIIEAAAAGIPAVASCIYGITDAVADEITGLLHPPGNGDAIVQQLSQLLSNPERCREMGVCARKRVLADFSCEESSRGLLAFYSKIMQ